MLVRNFSTLCVAVGIVMTAIAAQGDVPTCFEPPNNLEGSAVLIRDSGIDADPADGCLSCVEGCSGGGPCYECDDTDALNGDDLCRYDYQGGAAYETYGVTLDWYDDEPFSNAFRALDLHLAIGSSTFRVDSGTATERCRAFASDCPPGTSQAAHCTELDFTFHPDLLGGNWKQKDFVLYAVSDCESSEPFRKRRVAEHRERFGSPQASITASPNPCVHDGETVNGEDEPYCETDITWESTDLEEDYIVIYVRDNGTEPEWEDPIPTRCEPASSTPTTVFAQNIEIKDEEGITYELWEVPSCTPWPNYPPPGGKLLDTAVVTSEPEGTVLCKLDSEPMREETEIGILSNGIEFSCAAALNEEACYEDVAEKLAAIGVKYHRIAINWSLLYPSGTPCPGPTDPPPTLDFDHYDPLISAFSAEGIEPWITLNGSPPCYSTKPDPFPANCKEHDSQHYPPDLDDPMARDHWESYVGAVYDRYGPDGSLGLDHPARNWEVWQEPNGSFMSIDPVSCTPPDEEGQNINQEARYQVWQELQESAYDVIAQREGGTLDESTVWSANLVYLWNTPEEGMVEEWIDPQIATIGVDDMFNGYNLHLFHRDFSNSADPSRLSSLETAHQFVKYSRARLDDAGATSMPIAITAVTWHATTEEDPWEFVRELPDGEDRAQFLKDTYACLANAGADKILWFSATDYGYECVPSPPPEPPAACNDLATDPDCVTWGLGFLTVGPFGVTETPLYCAFADVCRHVDGCAVDVGVCE